MLKYARVLVERDERLSIPTIVPPWVVPVLELIHGAEKVTVSEEVDVDVEVPDAAAEYDRLQRCYGADVRTERAFSTDVYGAPPFGIQKLQGAINAAVVSEQSVDDPTA